MAIRIEPFGVEHVAAVEAFNERLDRGGVEKDFRFPTSPQPHWLPKLEGRRIYQEYYLALDEEDFVRGGYILKRQRFWLNGQEQPVGYYHLPLSEGLVSKAHTTIGIHLLKDALRREPKLYCLGMGGLERPLPRMLKAMGWQMELVPFLFHVARPGRFLREIPALRHPWWKHFGSRVAAGSGIGDLVFWAKQRTGDGDLQSCRVIRHRQFDDWVDRVWMQSCSRYRISAVRDAETLNVLYGRDPDRFLNLEIQKAGRTVGWAVLLNTEKKGDKHFGSQRVGSIVDTDAVEGQTATVMGMARRELAAAGADLIVTNQSHRDWVEGGRAAGFLLGPSNYAIACSKAVGAGEANQGHWTRGDGDGPIHL